MAAALDRIRDTAAPPEYVMRMSVDLPDGDATLLDGLAAIFAREEHGGSPTPDQIHEMRSGLVRVALEAYLYELIRDPSDAGLLQRVVARVRG